MYTNFNTLPQNSRIWIYQADREFTRGEVDLLQENAIAFIEEWTRHILPKRILWQPMKFY